MWPQPPPYRESRGQTAWSHVWRHISMSAPHLPLPLLHHLLWAAGGSAIDTLNSQCCHASASRCRGSCRLFFYYHSKSTGRFSVSQTPRKISVLYQNRKLWWLDPRVTTGPLLPRSFQNLKQKRINLQEVMQSLKVEIIYHCPLEEPRYPSHLALSNSNRTVLILWNFDLKWHLHEAFLFLTAAPSRVLPHLF